MSEDGYYIIAPPRDVLRFGRNEGQIPLEELPELYEGTKNYYKSILEPNSDHVDEVVVEERSLAPVLQDDHDALAAYLGQLVDGDIFTDSLNRVTTVSGWIVVCFDHTDGVKGSSTTLYLTPITAGALMHHSGKAFVRTYYESMH